jgi:hypothetical protein
MQPTDYTFRRHRLPFAAMIWLAAVLTGAGLATTLHLAGGYWQRLPSVMWELVVKGFQATGPVLVGLVPLALWLACILIRHLKGTGAGTSGDLDLGFIQRNAMLVGLAGTVCALISSTNKLAADVAKGSVAAVLALIPVVGQALVATLLGLIVAIGADILLHLRERKTTTVHEDASDT